MKETKPHKWSQAIYYVLASIVFLVLILFVAEMFFPSRSPELIPKMDRLSARIMTRLQDTPGRALSNPARLHLAMDVSMETVSMAREPWFFPPVINIREDLKTVPGTGRGFY